MKVVRKWKYAAVGIAFFGLGVFAYFLPGRTSFYGDSPNVIERCDAAKDKSQVVTERFGLLTSYYLLADDIDGDENYGPCPYQDYKVKTYGIELFAFSAVFIAGSALYRRREKL